jgi:hypothetical protein
LNRAWYALYTSIALLHDSAGRDAITRGPRLQKSRYAAVAAHGTSSDTPWP